MAKFDECSADYAEYFWDLHLNGESDGKDIFYVTIEPEDTILYPELEPGQSVRLWEDEAGYIHCEIVE